MPPHFYRSRLLSIIVGIIGLIVFASTSLAQNSAWTSIQLPNSTQMTDGDAGYPTTGCVIVAMLYALKFGPPSWRSVYNSIAGKTDVAKIQTLASEFGSEPSRYKNESKKRPAFVKADGVAFPDFPWLFQSLARGPLPAQKVYAEDLVTSDKAYRQLTEKFQQDVLANLERGEPVIATIIHEQTAHELTITGIQNSLNQNGEVKVAVLDPSTGQESFGTVSAGFIFNGYQPGTGLHLDDYTVFQGSMELLGVLVEPDILKHSVSSNSKLARNQFAIYTDSQQQNAPMTSVTICEPNTKHCQTIDRIFLDTGSVGLRLDSSLIRLKLPYVSSGHGQRINECAPFAGSDYFGPIQYADVRLGGIVAKKVRVQAYNDTGGDAENCPTTAEDGFNGTLGIGPLAKYDNTVSQDEQYFSCDKSGTCSTLSLLPPNVALENPIYQLESDNNGFMVSFPKLQKPRNGSITGTMTLGFSSETDNALPKQDQIFSLNHGGVVPVLFADQLHANAVFDSGTPVYLFPADPDPSIELCDMQKVLCPSKTVNFSLLVSDPPLQRSISIRIGSPFVDGENLNANPNISFIQSGYNAVVLGMPFFYGRKIFFGLPESSGSQYPNGFVAF